MLSMYLRHLFTKVCILRWISFVTSQVSHPYNSTDFTRALFGQNCISNIDTGARGDVVFKVPRYKLAGSGFDPRCYHWNFSVA